MGVEIWRSEFYWLYLISNDWLLLGPCLYLFIRHRDNTNNNNKYIHLQICEQIDRSDIIITRVNKSFCQIMYHRRTGVAGSGWEAVGMTVTSYLCCLFALPFHTHHIIFSFYCCYSLFIHIHQESGRKGINNSNRISDLISCTRCDAVWHLALILYYVDWLVSERMGVVVPSDRYAIIFTIIQGN